jgi:hypothetical protein
LDGLYLRENSLGGVEAGEDKFTWRLTRMGISEGENSLAGVEAGEDKYTWRLTRMAHI